MVHDCYLYLVDNEHVTDNYKEYNFVLNSINKITIENRPYLIVKYCCPEDRIDDVIPFSADGKDYIYDVWDDETYMVKSYKIEQCCIMIECEFGGEYRFRNMKITVMR